MSWEEWFKLSHDLTAGPSIASCFHCSLGVDASSRGVVLALGEIAMARLWIVNKSAAIPGDLSKVVIPTFFIHGRSVTAYFFYFAGSGLCQLGPSTNGIGVVDSSTSLPSIASDVCA